MPTTLFQTMAAQADRACEQQIAAARGEAQRIVETARIAAAESRQAALESTRAELERRKQRKRLIAEREAKRQTHAARHHLAEEALWAAVIEIRRIVQSPDEFRPILEALLAEALKGAGSEVVVLAPGAYLDAARAWLEKNGLGNLRVEAAPDIEDGVAVQDPGRTYRVSNTLSRRYAKLEGAARKHCMQRLFGGGSQP